MSDPLELPQDVHEAIQGLCAQGDELADQDAFDQALERYSQAWALLPEPQTDWEAATWVLAAIGDTCFHAGYLDSARDALDHVMACPGALGNPFLHLRRAKCCSSRANLSPQRMS